LTIIPGLIARCIEDWKREDISDHSALRTIAYLVEPDYTESLAWPRVVEWLEENGVELPTDKEMGDGA
jgi:hypothetical protein